MRRIGKVAGPVLIVVWTLVPLLWLVSLSLKGGDHINDGRFWPAAPTLRNYRTVFRTDLFTSALRNSIGISLIATVLSVLLATLAAYAIARLDFPGKRLILSVALAIAMFPTVALVGPLFDIWRTVGLYDTWPGLVIPYLSFTLPLSIWTLSAFFRQIPWEMEQAAQVDGATPWQAFRKVIVPLAAPGVFTAAILTSSSPGTTSSSGSRSPRPAGPAPSRPPWPSSPVRRSSSSRRRPSPPRRWW